MLDVRIHERTLPADKELFWGDALQFLGYIILYVVSNFQEPQGMLSAHNIVWLYGIAFSCIVECPNSILLDFHAKKNHIESTNVLS